MSFIFAFFVEGRRSNNYYYPRLTDIIFFFFFWYLSLIWLTPLATRVFSIPDPMSLLKMNCYLSQPLIRWAFSIFKIPPDRISPGFNWSSLFQLVIHHQGLASGYCRSATMKNFVQMAIYFFMIFLIFADYICEDGNNHVRLYPLGRYI